MKREISLEKAFLLAEAEKNGIEDYDVDKEELITASKYKKDKKLKEKKKDNKEDNNLNKNKKSKLQIEAEEIANKGFHYQINETKK